MAGRSLPSPRDARSAAAEAISRFLDAVVPPDARAAADLAGTPERVADAWLDDLVDGYRCDPAALLAGAMPSRGRDLVAVTGIDFHSMCPHHLLPSRGVAHVAYVPGGKVVGFGQLAQLVDCFAHRLALEEDVARMVAEALVSHLGARGAACILDAEQTCLSVRGELQPRARAHAQCFLGDLEDDARLQQRFLAICGRKRRSSTAIAPAERRGLALPTSTAPAPAEPSRSRAPAPRRDETRPGVRRKSAARGPSSRALPGRARPARRGP